MIGRSFRLPRLSGTALGQIAIAPVGNGALDRSVFQTQNDDDARQTDGCQHSDVSFNSHSDGHHSGREIVFQPDFPTSFRCLVRTDLEVWKRTWRRRFITRNPKSKTNPNSPMTQIRNRSSWRCVAGGERFEFPSFGFGSNFASSNPNHTRNGSNSAPPDWL